MRRTYVRRRVTVAVLAVLALGWGVPAAARAVAGTERAAPPARITYVVRAGDTLWDVAVRIAPDQDPRQVVDRLAAFNHLDPGSLTPGQAVVLPAA
jgi:Tfp pilus assembly protein FimV